MLVQRQRAYKTELDLNDHQTTACKQHAGATRWAYNWGLARKQEAYRQTGSSPSAIDLHRELNALKQTTVPWLYAVSKCAPQEALRNLDAAFAHFFRRCQLQRDGKLRGTAGYPQRKGSRNRLKAVRRLARLHRRIAHQRANVLHQVTSRLAKTKPAVVIEDLHVAGMLRNHHLAQAIGDVGWGEFRRQLEYKAAWYGCQVVVVSRWEPSSKTCSGCGWVDAGLTLADRTFRCHNPHHPECGLVLDRDLNAAINLAKLAGSSPDS